VVPVALLVWPRAFLAVEVEMEAAAVEDSPVDNTRCSGARSQMTSSGRPSFKWSKGNEANVPTGWKGWSPVIMMCFPMKAMLCAATVSLIQT
jgi:hypothetical protein